MGEVSEIARSADALLIDVVAESMSLGVLKAPGETGADIVAGEAQSFGMDLNFGGPYNGYLATRRQFVRQLPGRIAGETTDIDGKRVFVIGVLRIIARVWPVALNMPHQCPLAFLKNG